MIYKKHKNDVNFVKTVLIDPKDSVLETEHILYYEDFKIIPLYESRFGMFGYFATVLNINSVNKPQQTITFFDSQLTTFQSFMTDYIPFGRAAPYLKRLAEMGSDQNKSTLGLAFEIFDSFDVTNMKIAFSIVSLHSDGNTHEIFPLSLI